MARRVVLRRFARVLPLVVGCHLASPAIAHAGEGESSAIADALFREGRAAFLRGDYAQAAAKLTESHRLEPTAGTLVNLALAEEKLGRLAAAWEHARAALDQLSPTDDRRPPTRELFDRLDVRLPRLTLALGGRTPVAGLRIERDGIVLGAAALGTALPVDPGTHQVVVRVDGRSDAVYTVTLATGARETVLLEPGPVDAMASREGRADSSFMRTAGYASMIGGGAVVVTGAVFGLLAIDRKSDVDAECDPSGCSELGLSAARDGKTFATVSTVAVIGGAALLSAGIVMVTFAPSTRRIEAANVRVVGERGGAAARLTFTF